MWISEGNGSAILSELQSAGGGGFSSRALDMEVSPQPKGQEKACSNQY